MASRRLEILFSFGEHPQHHGVGVVLQPRTRAPRALALNRPLWLLLTHISCTFGHFSCEIGGCFFGINKHDRHPARSQNDRSERGRHHTKGTRYVVNSLAALLGASAAIWSVRCKPYTYILYA